MMRNLIGCVLCLAVLLFSVQVSESAVINLDARTTRVSPVVLSLVAGTYDVVPIGPAQGGLYTAGSIWAGTNCADPNGCVRTNPTTASGWLNWYDVISPALISVSVGGLALTPVPMEPMTPPLEPFFLVSPTETRYRGGDGLVYPTPADAFGRAVSSRFTLGSDADVQFWFPDGPNALSDNRGGVSLDVTPYKTTTTDDVAEPAAMLLLGTGLAALVARRRRQEAGPQSRRSAGR